jgi:hypothetical protein
MFRRWWFAIWPLLFTIAIVRAESPTVAQTPDQARKQLEDRLNSAVSVDFLDIPLQEVIATLRRQLRVAIVVDEPALDEDGISLNRPITLKLDDVSAKSVLHLLLHQVHLSWLIVEGKVKITTPREAQGKPVWRTHSIADLLITEADYVEERGGEELVNLIVQAVDPRSWKGGHGLGEIEFLVEEKALWVYQTRDNQEQIADLLHAIRRFEHLDFLYSPAWDEQ